MAWVETNVGSAEEAGALVDEILAQRLAACANVIRIESVYWWKGKMEHAAEFQVRFKAAPGQLKKCVGAVRAKHSYETPYLTWGTTADVDPGYAAWLTAESRWQPQRPRTRRKT